MPQNLEDRLTRLEELTFFQEERIEKLDAALMAIKANWTPWSRNWPAPAQSFAPCATRWPSSRKTACRRTLCPNAGKLGSALDFFEMLCGGGTLLKKGLLPHTPSP